MGFRIVAAISVTAGIMLAQATALAQGQQPRPGQLPPAGSPRPQAAPQQSPQQSAAKPYKPVTITAPKPVDDPSLDALRKQIANVAQKKDRAALAGLVSKSFFWMGEKGDKADKKKAGIDNLAKAIGLDAKDAEGWDTLASLVGDPTGGPFEDRKDTICAPGQPDFNDEEFGALLKATGTDDNDWGYPVQAGIEMHSSPQGNSPTVEKLGLYFVRVLEDQAAADQQVPMLKIVAPSGKTGYVPADSIGSLAIDSICYVKEGGAWKIGGYVGGE